MATEVLLSFRARISLGSLERFRSLALAIFASGKYHCTISQMTSFPAKVLESH
jgi:hypothetical protein